ncbi:MAG: serine/threonine-protein kinase [Polyangiales bacterium]
MGSEHDQKPVSEDSARAASEGGSHPGVVAASGEKPIAEAQEVERAHSATELAPPKAPSEWAGRVLDDRYRIERVLGEGGMGAVFVAEQLTLHKQVALKVIRAELAGNGEVAARFAREAMATAQFEHPHVASAIDYGTLPEGGAYFVMQLVRGRSLRGLLPAGKRLPWRRVCEIGAQVADALSAAKAAGIIHRDLKPDNVLVEPREDGSDLVKVLDFGIAHIGPRDAPAPAGAQAHRELTRVGTVMGTPGYMSPEQALGDRVDHRADLYALGVVLWECISGRELWDGPDLTAVVTRQMTEPVPSLRETTADSTLPAELDDLIARLTARALTDRPEHAADVRDTLRRLAQTSLSGVSATSLPTQPSFGRPALEGLQRALELYRGQPAWARYVQAGGALSALFVLGALSISGPESKPVPPKTDKPEATAPAPTTTSTVLAKVAEVAQKIMPSAQASAAAAKPKPVLPPELSGPAETLLDGKTPRERRVAAEKLLKYKPAERVFPHLLAIAQLEVARGCKARKQAIANMVKEPRSGVMCGRGTG